MTLRTFKTAYYPPRYGQAHRWRYQVPGEIRVWDVTYAPADGWCIVHGYIPSFTGCDGGIYETFDNRRDALAFLAERMTE